MEGGSELSNLMYIAGCDQQTRSSTLKLWFSTHRFTILLPQLSIHMHAFASTVTARTKSLKWKELEHTPFECLFIIYFQSKLSETLKLFVSN